VTDVSFRTGQQQTAMAHYKTIYRI